MCGYAYKMCLCLELGVLVRVKIRSLIAAMSTPGTDPTTMKEKKPRQQWREICNYILENEQRCGRGPEWWAIKDWFEKKSRQSTVLCCALQHYDGK